MTNKKISKIKLIGSLVITGSGFFAGQTFAQYSTINPSMYDQSSLVSKVQDSTDTFLYNLKPRFKSTNLFGFDDFRVKYITAGKNGQNQDTSVSFLTSNGVQSFCNINLVVQPDGRIFQSLPENTPPNMAAALALDSSEIKLLNNFKLSSLLLGCGLDTQASPFGDSTNEKRFSKINEFYKNGQVFNKLVNVENPNHGQGTSSTTAINVLYPSFYLLYRNNYADLLATTLSIRNDNDNNNYKNLFAKYHSINKLNSVVLRQSKGIPVFDTFNSYDIALQERIFDDIKNKNDKNLEDKVKSIAHESVMMIYLLGQRTQTESIMDVQTIKQAAIVRTVQELDKDFNSRNTETSFNRFQSPHNNLALKLAKNTASYMKNTLPSITGFNARVSSANQNNIKVIVNYIDKTIEEQKLDKLASIEYENMRKSYPEDVQSSLSKVNTVGFFTHPSDKLQSVYQGIYDEFIKYKK